MIYNKLMMLSIGLVIYASYEKEAATGKAFSIHHKPIES
jgi:hypothetical protein